MWMWTVVVVVCANVNHIKWIQTICGMFFSAFRYTIGLADNVHNGRDLILDDIWQNRFQSTKTACSIFMRVHICSSDELNELPEHK